MHLEPYSSGQCGLLICSIMGAMRARYRVVVQVLAWWVLRVGCVALDAHGSRRRCLCQTCLLFVLLLVALQNGLTAAIWAGGHEACLRMVVEAGADLNIQDKVWAMHLFCKRCWYGWVCIGVCGTGGGVLRHARGRMSICWLPCGRIV
jgi:hypothetical protein